MPSPLGGSKIPNIRKTLIRRSHAISCGLIYVVAPPAQRPSREGNAEEDNDSRNGDTTVKCGRKHIVYQMLVELTKETYEEHVLYLDHQAGLRRRRKKLKITLITHQDEKLTPVAGGTRLMAPKATGQEM